MVLVYPGNLSWVRRVYSKPHGSGRPRAGSPGYSQSGNGSSATVLYKVPFQHHHPRKQHSESTACTACTLGQGDTRHPIPPFSCAVICSASAAPQHSRRPAPGGHAGLSLTRHGPARAGGRRGLGGPDDPRNGMARTAPSVPSKGQRPSPHAVEPRLISKKGSSTRTLRQPVIAMRAITRAGELRVISATNLRSTGIRPSSLPATGTLRGFASAARPAQWRGRPIIGRA